MVKINFRFTIAYIFINPSPMKNLFIASLLLFTGYTFAQPQMDCEKFKDGKFMIPDDGLGASYIERKGDRQVEYGEGSGLKLAFKVEWVNECIYILTLTEVIENPTDMELPLGSTLKVEIIEVKANSYIQRSTMPGIQDVFESEMFQTD